MLRGCLGSIVSVLLVACVALLPQFSHAQLDNVDNPLTAEKHSGGAHKIAVLGLFDASETDGGQEDALINVIKGWVNWVLGIIGLIALIILLYGGLLMVTAAGNEERYNKGWTILKNAAIGLAVVGVAWFVVSIIFWLINQAADGAGAADTQN